MSETNPEQLGRYRIVDIIGRGAMGTVYKAIDPAIDRIVAIKTVNLALSKEDLVEYEARFQQEIKAAGRLNHPNIVTIYDVGRNEQLAYMAMEFLDGIELKDLLASGERPNVETTVDLMAQVADGLAFAHERDVVHRDIKPSNIMVIKVTNGVLAKITDFGIARMPASAVKTMTGMILGSPRYMSPEQVIGKTIDYRSDIFSLGVVLYETLTGIAPFDGDNVNAIMYATVNSNPVPPSTLNPDVAIMLDLIVAKALAKVIEVRYQSMGEFAADLREVRRMLANAGGAPMVRAAGTTPPARAKPVDAPPPVTQRPEQPVEDQVSPLKLAKQFDSFDATMRLAALMKQTDEFREYISETQKMRAYKGRVEGALGARMQAQPASAPAEGAPKTKTRDKSPPGVSTATLRIEPAKLADRWGPVLSVLIIGGLALSAIGLLIAVLR